MPSGPPSGNYQDNSQGNNMTAMSRLERDSELKFLKDLISEEKSRREH
jgi:hypothetical protein